MWWRGYQAASFIAIPSENWSLFVAALIQIMAASIAGRDIRYMTFGDELFSNELHDLLDLLYNCGCSVGMFDSWHII